MDTTHPRFHPDGFVFVCVLSFLTLIVTAGCGVNPSRGESAPGPSAPAASTLLPAASTSDVSPTDSTRIHPADLEYLGAFRLPDDADRPRTFAYGGNAMTFRPGADPEGDGFPGTLFITGHDRLTAGELPDGSQVAEVSIPAPVKSADVHSLNTAAFVQGFADLAAGHFAGLDEIPRIGLAYLDAPATGPLLHIAWGEHLPPDPVPATHAWAGVDLSRPGFQGEWFLGNEDFNSVNGYLFEIPADWAAANVKGRLLATGRFRDGGWSGMGPSLFAYRPWDDAGQPPAPGARLEDTVLLHYASAAGTDRIEHCLENYQHPDEWEGGAWLSMTNGKAAVIFAGTKSVGEKYWYGWANPAGPLVPCVEDDLVEEFAVCRLADGSACPPADLSECAGHNDMRGWWSTAFEARLIFYDPADLARVARGEWQPWQPQPYASLNLEPVLYHNPAGVEPDMLGQGPQRRFRIGDVAFDRANGLVYILELYADEAKPVVHVWRLGAK